MGVIGVIGRRRSHGQLVTASDGRAFLLGTGFAVAMSKSPSNLTGRNRIDDDDGHSQDLFAWRESRGDVWLTEGLKKHP